MKRSMIYAVRYDGYVFVDEMGYRIKPEYLTNQFPKFVERHGMKRLRFHDLRHSCASMLVAKNVSMKQVQLWLGHSTFSTTADIYAHLNANALDESAECISGVLAWDDDEDETEVADD